MVLEAPPVLPTDAGLASRDPTFGGPSQADPPPSDHAVTPLSAQLQHNSSELTASLERAIQCI